MASLVAPNGFEAKVMKGLEAPWLSPLCFAQLLKTACCQQLNVMSMGPLLTINCQCRALLTREFAGSETQA